MIPVGRQAPCHLVDGAPRPAGGPPLRDRWPAWDRPTYHERLKASDAILKEALARYP